MYCMHVSSQVHGMTVHRGAVDSEGVAVDSVWDAGGV